MSHWCPDCHGYVGEGEGKCNVCGGSGETTNLPFDLGSIVECSNCNGTGVCPTCDGTGDVDDD